MFVETILNLLLIVKTDIGRPNKLCFEDRTNFKANAWRQNREVLMYVSYFSIKNIK